MRESQERAAKRRKLYEEIGKLVYVKYRQTALSKVYSAVNDGRLQRPSGFMCEDCGQHASVYDHRDYGLPMNVAAVCDGCNIKRGMAALDLSRIRKDLSPYWGGREDCDVYFKLLKY